MEPDARHSPRHRWHLLALATPVVVYAGLVVLPWNPIYPGFLAMLAAALATLFCRPDLWRNTLVGGLSLGGCLALRAACEPRVERIVAFDVRTDFFEVVLRQTRPALRTLVGVLLLIRAGRLVNLMVRRVAKRSPVVEWGVQQGMHVTGTRSPYEFLLRIRQFRTTDISSSVTQHVLLLAGSEDHYVPLAQWHRQIASLTNARSLTARLFTREESAQNHYRAGNYPLALGTIVGWLESMAPAPVLETDSNLDLEADLLVMGCYGHSRARE